jgi:hypothetical protein
MTAWIFSPLIDPLEMVPIAKDFGGEFSIESIYSTCGLSISNHVISVVQPCE